MAEWAQRVLTGAGTWLARPWAVGAVFTFVVLWIAFDPHNFGWHGAATIATLLMTLLIQRSEHRDTQAIHAKLDELLRVNGKAQNQLATLDDKEPEQVEAFRTRSLVGGRIAHASCAHRAHRCGLSGAKQDAFVNAPAPDR